MASLQEFMALVVPWPQAGDRGVINIHWSVPDRKGMRGKPFSQLDQFLSFVPWANTHPKWVKDIYFCLSMQSEIGKIASSGKVTAKRLAQNALFLKAIWLDLDVKDKSYKTLDAALAALQTFIQSAGLPPPSALVSSGGGVHVYWISDKPLTTEEWRPYAEGLKAAAIKYDLICDYGVTTDEARILRIPGTYNHKTMPARPVKLMALGNCYDFKLSLEGLRGVGAAVKRVAPVATQFEMALPGKPAAAFSHLTPEKFEGIGYSDAPLAWGPLVGECAFFREALKTGGAEYSQPMWNLSTLMATFLEDGHALAHKMGNKHVGYSPESTDALWDRKIAERKDRGLGWPSCHAIQSAGCSRCAVCPHLEQARSPLNLTTVFIPLPSRGVSQESDPSTPFTVASPPVGSVDLERFAAKKAALPAGYDYDVKTGAIGKLVERDMGNGLTVTEFVPMFLSDMDLEHAWAEREPDVLHFNAVTSKGVTREIVIKQEHLATTQSISHMLASQGILFVKSHETLFGDFFMYLLKKLHDAKAALRSVSYGWFEDEGIDAGFAYGGKLFLSGGDDTTCSMGDPETRKIYTPCGSIEPWFEALNLVLSQKRPDLEVLTAVAFAAPLMKMTGMANGTVSAYGPAGAGKSTALEVGAAVWGHRKLSKMQPDVTKKSLLEKMGQLRNLPIYWDDIRDYQMEKVGETLISVSNGAEGGTLTRNRDQRATGSWESVLVVTSNYSMVDHLLKKNKNDAATLYRTFEFNIPKSDTDPTDMPTFEADRLMMKLATNFGNMGVRYSQLLAADPKWIAKELEDTERAFAVEVNQTMEERFWLSLCAGILCGAKLAALVGVKFDVPEIHKFLVATYIKQRDRVKVEAAVGGTEDHTRVTLAAFVKSCADNTLRTDKMPAGPGNPKGSVHMITHPRNEGAKIHVNWVMHENVLRISKEAFFEFMDERGVSPTIVVKGLRDHYGAKVKTCNLTAGTPFNGVPEPSLMMPFEEGSWLYQWAHAYQNADETDQESAAVIPPTVDSGLAATH